MKPEQISLTFRISILDAKILISAARGQWLADNPGMDLDAAREELPNNDVAAALQILIAPVGTPLDQGFEIIGSALR